jgi:uncharacterized protein
MRENSLEAFMDQGSGFTEIVLRRFEVAANVTFPTRSFRHDRAMKLQEHDAASLHTITGYGEEWIAVNAQRFSGSLLVMPEGVLEPWEPQRFEDLNAPALEAISLHKPDLVLLGTGALQRFLHPRLSTRITACGIGLECMATPAACRTYNILMAEGRRVLAALLPTQTHQGEPAP